MLYSYLYYSTDAIYYIIKQSDEARKELIVTRRVFPFINRKFNIKVISINESVSNISVRELGMRHLNTRRANHLGNLLVALF